MHPQLENYCSEFRAVKDEATALPSDTEERTLSARPDPESWAPVECIEHLNTTGRLLVEAIEQAIERAQEEGPYGEPPFEYGFISRWFVRSLKPSSGWTLTAPSVYEPAPLDTLSPHQTIDDFLVLQDRFSECVAAADGLDLRRLRIPSPALPLLRISVGAWFEATLAHERRHLAQAERTLRALAHS